MKGLFERACVWKCQVVIPQILTWSLLYLVYVWNFAANNFVFLSSEYLLFFTLFLLPIYGYRRVRHSTIPKLFIHQWYAAAWTTCSTAKKKVLQYFHIILVTTSPRCPRYQTCIIFSFLQSKCDCRYKCPTNWVKCKCLFCDILMSRNRIDSFSSLQLERSVCFCWHSHF